jgi:protein phosphatase 1G
MQGWRKRMEDAHISDIGIGPNNQFHLFGVFDGHGGKEVSQFVKKHYTQEFLNLKSFKSGNIKGSLTESFIRIDDLLVEPNGKAELKAYAKQSKEDDEKRSAKEKNKQMDLFKQLFDYKNQEDSDVAMMTGCTANVCCIDQAKRKIYFANSGDSRSVMCKKGIAYPMSIDHKPDMDVEKNRIYKADGWVSEGRVKGKLKINFFILNFI